MAFLIDSSVWGRVHQKRVADRVGEIADGGHAWTCRPIDLEVIYSVRARNLERDASRRRLMPNVPISPTVMDRSLEVAILMADAGLHRHAKPMDLIIAAAAEVDELTVLHYDRDFDYITSVTGQPTEWVAPPGSLD